MAYLDGVPVGTSTLSVAPLSAGIWNLATSPDYRKHGIGGALVHAALVEAKKRTPLIWSFSCMITRASQPETVSLTKLPAKSEYSTVISLVVLHPHEL